MIDPQLVHLYIRFKTRILLQVKLVSGGLLFIIFTIHHVFLIYEVFSANECIGILQVFEKVPFEKLSTPHLGTLFLQLTVEDMGICIPLNPLPPVSTNNQQYYTLRK